MAISSYLVMGKDESGHPKLVGLSDSGITDSSGNVIWSLAVNSAVSIDPGTITIGSITLKDGIAATLVAVKTATTIVGTDKAVASHDPAIGQIGDAVGAGTVIGLLQGIYDRLAP